MLLATSHKRHLARRSQVQLKRKPLVCWELEVGSAAGRKLNWGQLSPPQIEVSAYVSSYCTVFSVSSSVLLLDDHVHSILQRSAGASSLLSFRICSIHQQWDWSGGRFHSRLLDRVPSWCGIGVSCASCSIKLENCDLWSLEPKWENHFQDMTDDWHYRRFKSSRHGETHFCVICDRQTDRQRLRLQRKLADLYSLLHCTEHPLYKEHSVPVMTMWETGVSHFHSDHATQLQQALVLTTDCAVAPSAMLTYYVVG